MDVQGGLAPRADRLRLPILLKGECPLEQGRGCGLWLPAADLGLYRLLGHELDSGERRPLPSHTPALPCDGCTARPSFATLTIWQSPNDSCSTPSAGRRSSIRRSWHASSARPTRRSTERVSNQQKWDTLGAERSGAGWRSGELPEGPVVASSPFGGLSLHLLPAL